MVMLSNRGQTHGLLAAMQLNSRRMTVEDEVFAFERDGGAER